MRDGRKVRIPGSAAAALVAAMLFHSVPLHAEGERSEEQPARSATRGSAEQLESRDLGNETIASGSERPNGASAGHSAAPQGAAAVTPEIANTAAQTPIALPAGGTTVSPQAVALPSGPSSILGMGESFTTQLSTGIVSFTIPLKLLTARGGVQPRLDLAYSSAMGFGLAGKGWSMGASAISRQTDRGVPRYADGPTWHPEQDRFVFGGMELVPICTVDSGACAGAQANESMPVWADGWQYFRARVEGGFLRFFWKPDHRTWRVQSKDGGNFELGVPLDGSEYTGALEMNPEDPKQIFRWYIVRQYDSEAGVNSTAAPEPVNSVVYRYMRDGQAVYLTDIFDTSPAADPTDPDLSHYAHHTRIVYEARPDIVRSFRSGWLVETGLRVARIDVTSKPFSGSVTAARELVRRYRLSYASGLHTSMLSSVQMEGRCTSAVEEQSDQTLGSTNCPRLPPIKFEYQQIPGAADRLLDGSGYAFEGFNTEVRALKDSPPHSLDEALTGMMDVDANGLPDVIVTAPGLFDGKHAVFFNGLAAGGGPGFEALTKMGVQRLDGVDAGVLRLDNANVAPLDLDADGLINLVHMPKAKAYSIFSPKKSTSGWNWVGRSVSAASNQDVKIDFTRDGQDIRVMDVNADGLVDVVYSSPTEVQTYFALGRYSGGHDQFGQAVWTAAASANIQTEPVTSCAPWSGQTVRFSDPDVRIADLNGDGFPDIARVRSGQVLYWPGRGTGFWGIGPRAGCPAGELATNRHIEMMRAPRFGVTRPGALLLNDVNGDGLADFVEVRSQGVDIYLNDNGVAWTERHVIEGTPFLPSTGNYARLTDIDGSGTPDILWGRGYEYKYVDLTGGVTPQLLTKTTNGLGATTELEYESTVEVMRQAAADGNPWSSFTPTVSPLLVRSTVRDHLEQVGRPGGTYTTEYAYRDPVYEGRQREFRGFREATVRTLGDTTGPTSLKRTVFQLGECSENFQGSLADVCSPSLRWQDNWREALKGLPVLIESFDEGNVYLSTEHLSYELRQLYTGLDGRRVTVAYPLEKESFLYDTADFDASPSTITMDEVQANLEGITHTETRGVVRRDASSGTARLRTRTEYDDFGNVTKTIREGCVAGCASTDETITAESEFALPEDDDSGWLWREATSYVTGSVQTARRNELIHTYNPQGKLVETRAVLWGTLELDENARFHELSAEIADPPAEASGGVSSPVEIVLVQNTYNSFGQVIFTRGPNGRCSSGNTDTLYKQLPVSASVFVGDEDSNGCGVTELMSSATFDRGLEAPIESLDATDQPASFTYDGFGRLTSATSADPDDPGNLASNPSITVEYLLPSDPAAIPYSITIARVLDGEDFETASYSEKWAFSDALGRTLATLTEADPDAGDGGDWIVGGAAEYNMKGELIRAHDPWYHEDEPETFSLADAPPSGVTCAPRGSVSTEYDAFGRVIRKRGRDDVINVWNIYHAVSQDIYDALDLEEGDAQGTFVTVVSNGHGRGIQSTQRTRVGGSIEQRHVLSEYLPTGEVTRIIQHRTGSTDVVRWLRYDSLGRVVLNAEPNTSPNFDPDPSTPADDIKAFRYAYNDAGQLVGFSDARGCGSNYYYDRGGRLIAEDRSPCLEHHAAHTDPTLSNGNGTEAFYLYDGADPDSSSITDRNNESFAVSTSFLLGRLASVSGLGSKTVFNYDALGRVIGTAVRVVKPGSPASTLSSRYAPAWYTKTQSPDVLDRPLTATTGLPGNVTDLLGTGNASELSFDYSKSGKVSSITGSYGTLFAGGQYLADGRPDTLILGDAAETERGYCYDINQRVSSVTTYRAEAPIWSDPPSGYTPPGSSDYTDQILLEDSSFSYDAVGNILTIEDHRTASEWPSSAKPLSRTFEYDDLYRLKRVTYDVAGGGSDPWTPPFAAENSDSSRPQPSPHVSFTNRIEQQDFAYDWLGNPEETTDDQHGFWDRSLGESTVGSAASGPHQITAASNRSLAPTSSRKGDLSVAHDDAGNMTDLIVRRDGSCLPSTATCWQRFHYEWNEVGELSVAQRWDLTTSEQSGDENDIEEPPPTRTPDAELVYAYGPGGDRVMKTAGTKHTLYIFGSLEVRSTTWDSGASPPDYLFDETVVQLRVPAGPATGRILYSTESLPTVTGGQLHTFLELGDHLGSTTSVIDRATGELVEFSTYQAYGAAESDFRPGRWAEFREPVKFSGKEEDIEVGLAYFGARYYSPYVNVWLSPDPVTIHDLGSDMNPYAYVYGTPLMGVDPDGRNPILIGIGIAVAVNIVQQQATTGHVNWGWDGVLGAAVIGGVSGGVASGVSAGVLASGGSVVEAGLVSGIAGSAAGYTTSSAITGQGSGSGFATAMASGGVAGLVGGAVGVEAGSSVGGRVASSTAGTMGGATAAIAMGQDPSMLSLGLGLAAATASAAAADEEGVEGPERHRSGRLAQPAGPRTAVICDSAGAPRCGQLSELSHDEWQVLAVAQYAGRGIIERTTGNIEFGRAVTIVHTPNDLGQIESSSFRPENIRPGTSRNVDIVWPSNVELGIGVHSHHRNAEPEFSQQDIDFANQHGVPTVAISVKTNEVRLFIPNKGGRLGSEFKTNIWPANVWGREIQKPPGLYRIPNKP